MLGRPGYKFGSRAGPFAGGPRIDLALSRRGLLAGVTGSVALALGGCGDGSKRPPEPRLGPNGGTPVVSVKGYDDQKRWQGRALQVAAWGGEVQTALREIIWQ